MSKSITSFAVSEKSVSQTQAGKDRIDIERLTRAAREQGRAVAAIETRTAALEISSLKRRLADQEKASASTADELRRRASHFEHELNIVRLSTSWRLTAPFRAFLSRFPLSARLLRRTLKLAWWTVTFQLVARLRQRRQIQKDVSGPAMESQAENLQPSIGPPIGSPAGSSNGPSIESRLAELESLLSHERQRLDYALFSAEGMTHEIELYHRARDSAEYQQAFDQHDPLVSICVATMNRPDLLIDRCLTSLLNQTYRNIQIIVVGDNCTDDTGARVARLGDDRISFFNLPSRGPYPAPGIDRWRVAGTNAINAALARSEGQFITHLDDDDSVAADRIDILVRAAQAHRADFCWHPLWCENNDGTWFKLGDGRFELGQMTTGSIFYHRYFKKIPWDVHSYRIQEPGDWNRLRKIRTMRPNLHFVDQPLMFHYTEGSQPPFVRQNGENFLQ